jgi:hypothetical protein
MTLKGDEDKKSVLEYSLDGDSDDYLEIDQDLMTCYLKLTYTILPQNCRRKEENAFVLNSDQIFLIVSSLQAQKCFLAGHVCQICEVLNCRVRQKMPTLFNH